ncbi:MAG: hypothetical protein H7Y86_18590 [Rhizobacter sp.]|nr:hypothetical protein [Ferruginibacter sp.]
MRKHFKQVAAALAVVLLFLLAGFSAAAQEIPKADNSIHDRMYFLAQKSDKILLPAEVSAHVRLLNTGQPNSAKRISAQTAALKVLYNKNLSKDDILFFGNQLLKIQSSTYTPLHVDIKKLLTNL